MPTPLHRSQILPLATTAVLALAAVGCGQEAEDPQEAPEQMSEEDMTEDMTEDMSEDMDDEG